MYTITLANGNVLRNISLNGSVFTTTNSISREDFAGGLKQVIISGPTDEASAWQPGTYRNMRLSYFRDAPDHKEFCLAFITETELEQIKQRADLEYVAMMAGVEL